MQAMQHYCTLPTVHSRVLPLNTTTQPIMATLQMA
jgi:hypothetical protein